jgi:condensin-2 complex subunit D3
LIIKTFVDNLQSNQQGATLRLHNILIVINSWLNDFSLAGLNRIFVTMNDLIRKGTSIALAKEMYSICCRIKEKSDKKLDPKWVMELRDEVAEHLLAYAPNYMSMHLPCGERYLSSLIVYSEACTDLEERPDNKLLHLMIKYVKQVVQSHGGSSKYTRNIFFFHIPI